MGASPRALRALVLLGAIDWAATLWAPGPWALKLDVVTAVLAVPVVRGMLLLRTAPGRRRGARPRHRSGRAAALADSSTVMLAWKIRGSKGAQYTTQEQFEGFRRTLNRSRGEHARAAALAPEGDPAPYVGEIWTAIGIGYSHEEMHRVWKELAGRAPHHYEATFSALQYWCAKWRGSEALARAFAVRAAAEGPAGSLMSVFPLIAHFEHDTSDSADVDRTPEMYATVDEVLADVAAADPDHPRLAEVRHLLAYYLYLQERWDEALEQFRLTATRARSRRGATGATPREEFCRMRDECVANGSGA
ncbi:hypothetical protein [Streptomyces lateritius]|uniref:hypothetical protein n=1 Tax=Streptomyces lateritius TaxID=67313 RepID=UPI00167A46F3|nr:hypothetical protein [Streptomyces lateritius]GGT83709.1 hypothetical protein GCM10010272_30550 [Streptomyces lateritius]